MVANVTILERTIPGVKLPVVILLIVILAIRSRLDVGRL